MEILILLQNTVMIHKLKIKPLIFRGHFQHMVKHIIMFKINYHLILVLVLKLNTQLSCEYLMMIHIQLIKNLHHLLYLINLVLALLVNQLLIK